MANNPLATTGSYGLNDEDSEDVSMTSSNNNRRSQPANDERTNLRAHDDHGNHPVNDNRGDQPTYEELLTQIRHLRDTVNLGQTQYDRA